MSSSYYDRVFCIIERALHPEQLHPAIPPDPEVVRVTRDVIKAVKRNAF